MIYLNNRRKHHGGHGDSGAPTYSWVVEDGVLTTTLANQSFTLDQTPEATYIDKDGVMQAAVDNTPRLTANGMMFETGEKNIWLDGRDGPDSWTKSNITTATGQTDHSAGSSAVKLTADANNGTLIADALDSDHTDHCFSASIKRITGSGAVYMTIDNGATWTEKTITSSFVRYYEAKTATDPQIGFKLATSGDEIVVDAVQVETGAYPSSYVETHNVALGAEELTNGDFSATSNAAAVGVDGITKANPGVVTFDPGHGYEDGQTIYFDSLTEMTELNTQYWILRSNAGDTFELETTVGSSLDTSGYVAAETTGGNCAQLCSD